ncbi:phospholipid transport system substrate-binding protein [Arboricoccus pini]|uniref:Phospholipid transport system substrate-binding protein n=1 Tax=Arboricoccus pini TaxID=1963835 RepID=A0A212QRH7_9PROT|nr:ABC transporter substrate-binding protein [Arboricoccus pini]SNB62188.1 phospholipid transport system substrate-binding protein [Arboricoccus pini]
MAPSNLPIRLGNRRVVLQGLLATALLPLLLKFSPFAMAQTTDGAEAFVQSLGDEALKVLKSNQSTSAKIDQLKGLLTRAVNLELVSRLVAGRYWRDMNDAQHGQFVDLFRQLSIKTMADSLSSYSGQTFKVAGSRAADDRDTVVSTLIMQPGGAQPTHVDWRVRSLNGQYTIVDIVAEGVSLVVTQRNEVNSIAGSQGIPGLLAEMQRRLQSNEPLRAG